MVKYVAVLLLATVLLFNIVQADDDHTGHNHDEGLDCPCIVTLELKPVCASNGVTYSNRRSFDCALKCKKEKGLKADFEIVKEGHC